MGLVPLLSQEGHGLPVRRQARAAAGILAAHQENTASGTGSSLRCACHLRPPGGRPGRWPRRAAGDRARP